MSSEAFTATEYREPMPAPGKPYRGPEETLLGTFQSEKEAIDVARARWREHRESGSNEVAWWLVRRQGESLARWIAESRSDVERVLDLTTNELVEVAP
jgi:hypothetical protein